jgi:hypothetical protein
MSQDVKPTLERMLIDLVSDSINRYINQVLIPGGYVDEGKLRRDFKPGNRVCDGKYEVAECGIQSALPHIVAAARAR